MAPRPEQDVVAALPDHGWSWRVAGLSRTSFCRWCHGLPGFDFALMKAFQDGRAPWYLRSLIRKPLREIGVILFHDVERCFLGEAAMVPGKYPVHRCEQFIGHDGYCCFSARYWLSTT
jgi:hypothetical protein